MFLVVKGRKRWLLGLVAVFLMLIGGIFLGKSASAASIDELFKRAWMNNLYSCYDETLSKKVIDVYDANSWSFIHQLPGTQEVVLPGWDDAKEKNIISCKNYVGSNEDPQNIYKLFKRKESAPPDTPDKAGSWLGEVGYTKQGDTTYKITNLKSAFKKGSKFITGTEVSGPQNFSRDDVVALYNFYIRVAGAKLTGKCSKTEPSSGYYLYTGLSSKDMDYVDMDRMMWCEVDPNGAEDKWFSVFDNKNVGKSNLYYFDNVVSFGELLRLSSTLNKNVKKGQYVVYLDLEDIGPLSSSTNDDLCVSTAGSLNWIICPAIAAVTGAGQMMWKQVEGALQFDVSMLDNGSNAEAGWVVMRDTANIIFIILFLFVIFSQLTGVGIDNYGIKKILPKLIVIAILINLSFVLCKVFIDLSNILGVGLNNLLSGLAPKLPEAAMDGAMNKIGGMVNLTLGGIAIGGIFAALNGVFTKEGTTNFVAAAAIGILGAIITVVAGILVVYLILMIRTAGIVIATVVAPVAIVLYALPNTEKISKKWLEAFKALLVVYPLCGAVVGAGEFAKGVLYGASPMLALISSVVPYFFIPFLLVRSLSAMGNLGARISTLGRNFGRRSSGAATGAIRNNERYKDWQRYNRNQVAIANAGRRMRGLNRWANIKQNLGMKNPKNKRYMAAYSRAQMRMTRAENEQEEIYRTSYSRRNTNDITSTFNQDIFSHDAPRAGAAFETLMAVDGEDKVLDMIYNNNFNSLDLGVQGRLLKSFASSNNEILSAFAKYRSSGGNNNFQNWFNGVSNSSDGAEVKNKSFAEYLNNNGTTAMNKMSRKSMKFMREHDGAAGGTAGAAGWSAQVKNYNQMVGSAVVNVDDPTARLEAEEMMEKSMKNGARANDFGFTAESLSSMRPEVLNIMYQEYKNRVINNPHFKNLNSSGVTNHAQIDLRNDLARPIAKLRKDPTLLSRTHTDVRTILGI